MTHYVCPSCGNTAQKPGVCNTDGCSMLGTDMLECHCPDEQHGDIMNDVA